MRKRAATVEPVLGSLIEYYGLRKISVKKRKGAAKVMYMAAIAYNLKKYLRYGTSNPQVKAEALPIMEKLFFVTKLLQQPRDLLYNGRFVRPFQ